ncbi:MAG TPA: response regulator, partial [Gemmatimonadaceae bacterium]
MTEDRRVKLLLVDDRQENLVALQAILEPLGQTLVLAHSGEEALKSVLQHDFACILLDVQMPEMNGFDVAQIIKSREKSRYIPIIFLSAISKEDAYVFKGYSMGAVDYVFKPFNPDVLRSKVAVFVDLYLKQ